MSRERLFQDRECVGDPRLRVVRAGYENFGDAPLLKTALHSFDLRRQNHKKSGRENTAAHCSHLPRAAYFFAGSLSMRWR